VRFGVACFALSEVVWRAGQASLAWKRKIVKMCRSVKAEQAASKKAGHSGI
jgi:hypothetical protein